MIDVGLIRERKANKQARDTSKCTNERIWHSHAFVKLAFTQKHTCPIPAALSRVLLSFLLFLSLRAGRPRKLRSIIDKINAMTRLGPKRGPPHLQ